METIKTFDGAAYEEQRDHARLNDQLTRVMEAMAAGGWHTLSQLAASTQSPHASVSAQLRNMRKARFGAWNVERRYVGNGLFEYRVNGKRELNYDPPTKTEVQKDRRIAALETENRQLRELLELRSTKESRRAEQVEQIQMAI